jgi:hypothetical protein
MNSEYKQIQSGIDGVVQKLCSNTAKATLNQLEANRSAFFDVSGTPAIAASIIQKPVTAQELSAIVPLHPVTILRWAREGKIPHRRLSARKIVFMPVEINEWLASGSSLYTDPATRAASTERLEAA